ncbi:MAG: TM2 domain-containing protein [Candidatus Eisenbacteria bacterium]|nr:TM2 domain-containing protein [Candidatus Eisenbacteria bacterium]
MYCRNCGKELVPTAEFCTACGARPQNGNRYCMICGHETRPEAEICVNCGSRLVNPAAEGKSWFVALILSIFVGWFGIDRFYLGKIGTGILKLLTFGLMGIWWLIDIILIATDNMNDSDGRPLVKGKNF